MKARKLVSKEAVMLFTSTRVSNFLKNFQETWRSLIQHNIQVFTEREKTHNFLKMQN